MSRTPSIYTAIDTIDLEAATNLATAVKPHIGGLKLGLEFFLRQGHAGVRAMATLGLPVFLDLKLHDIPNTVAGGITAVMPLRPALITVHASGGMAMVAAAREAAEAYAAAQGGAPAKIIAVSVLTSLDKHDLDQIGVPKDPADQVVHLARMAVDAGADGIVCSPREISLVRAACGPSPLIISPGIRPLGDRADDQKRVMTPFDAVSAGADILVIGRPITQAKDPAEAAQLIAEEIAG